MAKDFGGDLISQGKNTKATGGGAENLEVLPVQKEMEKTAHISFHITGPDVDNVNWYELICAGEGEDFQITHADVKYYYTTKRNNDSTGNKS